VARISKTELDCAENESDDDDDGDDVVAVVDDADENGEDDATGVDDVSGPLSGPQRHTTEVDDKLHVYSQDH
jgi:hypothetical protein